MKIRQNIVKLQKETTSPELKEAASNLLVEFDKIMSLDQTPNLNEAFANAKYKEFITELNGMEINESDKGALAFRTKVNNEIAKDFITNHLGINESINILKESNYAGHPTLKYLVEGFSQNLKSPEYLLVESYMNTFAKFSYIPVIRDSFTKISENVRNHDKDILLYSTLDKLSGRHGQRTAFSGSNFVLENFKTQINDYLDNRTDAAKNRLVESLSKFSMDRGVKNLIDVLNTINESNAFDIKGFSANCDVSSVYSLVFENNNNLYFNIGQSLYMVEGADLTDDELEGIEEGNSPTLDDVKIDDLKLVTVDDVEKIAEGHNYLLTVDFILRNGVNVSENLITVPYGKGKMKTIKIYEAEGEEDELLLDEAMLQVIDPNSAIKELKKIGVTAKPGKLDDEVEIVSVKDKAKMKKWLEDSGWEAEDVKSSMPELYSKVYEGEEPEKDVVVEMDGEKMDVDKVEEKLGKGALMNPADREVATFIKRIYENFDNFGKIDIAKRFTSKATPNQFANVFKVNENFYVHKVDGINNVQVFENVNALTARDTIFEFLGYDISESFSDLIARDLEAVKINEKVKADFQSNITKLEEQRDALLNHENPAVRTSAKIVAIVENLNSEIEKLEESYRRFNEGEEVKPAEQIEEECDEVSDKLKEAEEEAENIIEEMKAFLAVKRMFEEDINPDKSDDEEELQDELEEANRYLKFKSIFEAEKPEEGLNKDGEVDDKSIHSKNVGDKTAGGTVIAVDDAEGEATIALDAGGTKQIKESDDEDEDDAITEMRRFLAVRTLFKLTEGEEVEDGEEEISEMRKFITLKRIFEDLAEEGNEPTDKVEIEKEIIAEAKKFKFFQSILEELAEEGNEPDDKVELRDEIVAEMNTYISLRSIFESDDEDEDDIIDEMYQFLNTKSLFENEEEEEDEEMKEAKRFLRLRKLAEGEVIEEEDDEKEEAIKETNRYNKLKAILEGKMPQAAIDALEKSRKDENDDEDEDDKVEEGMEEGNAFGEAVTKAKKDGKDSFELDGKTYKVTEDGEYELVGNLDDDEGKLEEGKMPQAALDALEKSKEEKSNESDDKDEDDILEGEDSVEELEEQEDDILESINIFKRLRQSINEKINESEDEEEIAELTEEDEKVEESINALKTQLRKISILLEGAEMKTVELDSSKTEITPKKKVGDAVTVKGEKGTVTAIGGADEIATVALDKGGAAVIAEGEEEDETEGEEKVEEGLNVGDSVSYNGVDATVSGIADGMVTLTGNFEDGEQTITVPEGEVKGDVTPIGESEEESEEENED